MATAAELCKAAERDDVNAVHALVDRDVDVDCKAELTGETPLASACTSGSVSAAQALLSLGASVHTQFSSGCSALRAAVAASQHDTIELLLKAGADPNEESVRGSILSAAVTNDDVEVARMLVQHGANPDREERSGFSPLMLASSHKNASLVEMLLGAPSDPQKPSTSNSLSALDMAEQKGHTDIAAMMMKHSLRSTLKQSKSRTSERVREITREAEQKRQEVEQGTEQRACETKLKVDALRNENDKLKRRLELGLEKFEGQSNVEISRKLAGIHLSHDRSE